MVWVRIVLCLALSLPLARAQESNASDFVATSEWQEIKPGKNSIENCAKIINEVQMMSRSRTKSSVRTSLQNQPANRFQRSETAGGRKRENFFTPTR